jgi:SPP1 Gp6-like portal protein
MVGRATFTGGYDTPIIMGVTPYTRTRYRSPLGSANDWPPLIDSDRIETLEVYEALIENRVWDVFESARLSPEQATKVQIAIALPELLCNVWADALYGSEGTPVDIEFAADATRDRFDDIWRDNGGFDVLGWEGVFGTAFSGFGFWKLRRAGEDELRREEIVIEELDPRIVFPRLKRDGRTIDHVVLAYEEADFEGDREVTMQRRERHFMDGEQYVIQYATRRAGETAWIEWEGPGRAAEERPDGVNFLPFVDMHAKRWRGRYWGVSELARQMSAIDEIDDRLSAIGEILDYHGNPLLVVPKSTMFGGVFYKGSDRVIGAATPEDAQIARYVTFEGMINEQISAIDKVLELISLTAEIPLPYFGITEGATYSGSALRLRLQNYLKKASRWQRKDESRIRLLAQMALELDGSVGSGDALVPTKITYGDPLPADDFENSNIESTLVGAKLSSRKTSITRLRRVDDVDEEMKLIDDESEADVTAAQGAGNVPAPAGLTAAGIEPVNPTNGAQRPTTGG